MKRLLSLIRVNDSIYLLVVYGLVFITFMSVVIK